MLIHAKHIKIREILSKVFLFGNTLPYCKVLPAFHTNNVLLTMNNIRIMFVLAIIISSVENQ